MFAYYAILPEHVHVAAEALGPDQGVRLEGLALYSDSNCNSGYYFTCLLKLKELGIAYNAGWYSDHKRYDPSLIREMRFDHTGNYSQTVKSIININATRREIFHKQMAPKGIATRDIDRIAHVLFIRDEWDNQVEYGKLHRMLSLIGAV